MADIIKVEHLSYVYNPGMPNAVTALDDVSFTVEEGDFVGIIGATGSGKSTLITHMNGLNKPTSGKIYIDGRDLWEDPGLPLPHRSGVPVPGVPAVRGDLL
jgi:ABC-type oligopeptide transport system ATPase subunit